MNNIIVMNDNILVKLSNKNETAKLESGILLPAGHTQNIEMKGLEVIGIDNGNTKDVFVKIGDRVIFDKRYGTIVEFAGNRVSFVPKTNILGVIRGK